MFSRSVPVHATKCGHIDYRIEDSIVRRIVNENSSLTLLQSGIPFDLNVLDAERGRISNRLQNSGYYKFNKEYIRYEADTCVGNHEVDLKVGSSRFTGLRRTRRPKCTGVT